MFLHGPYPTHEHSAFDMFIDTMVPGEVSTPSQTYVDIGHSIKHTAHRYGFASLATESDNQVWVISVKTSDAAVAVYVRILRGGTVISEYSHDGDTNWDEHVFVRTPSYTSTYEYQFQLRTSGNAVAYAKNGWYMRTCLVNDNHGFYVLRG